ncbi:MAG TPA: hypothetical protein VFZ27_13265 [Terriglobia bacterium]|nr:hypothetical protein [Terriglobia bacterium]
MNPTPINDTGNPKERSPGAHAAFNSPSVTESTPLLWLTVLSLDAPAVAVLWQLLFAKSFQVRIGAGVTILLALVVWLIYVADRLLDAWKSPPDDAEATRHLFYRRHLWGFLFPLGAGSALAAWLALTQLDVGTFGDGILIFLGVGIYLLIVHLVSPRRRWFVPKELLVGILFALGTCFPIWQGMAERTAVLFPACALFAGLCWMNCAVIEHAEWNRLRGRRFGLPHPWTVWMGKHFLLLSVVAAAIAAVYMFSGLGRPHWQIPAAELLSALTFAVIRNKEHSLSIDQFRVLVDVALFTPIFFLIQ